MNPINFSSIHVAGGFLVTCDVISKNIWVGHSIPCVTDDNGCLELPLESVVELLKTLPTVVDEINHQNSINEPDDSSALIHFMVKWWTSNSPN